MWLLCSFLITNAFDWIILKPSSQRPPFNRTRTICLTIIAYHLFSSTCTLQWQVIIAIVFPSAWQMIRNSCTFVYLTLSHVTSASVKRTIYRYIGSYVCGIYLLFTIGKCPGFSTKCLEEKPLFWKNFRIVSVVSETNSVKHFIVVKSKIIKPFWPSFVFNVSTFLYA